jgi:hypothetical protein
MSYFFKGTELPFRLATFWMANRLTDVVAPLTAFGLLRSRGVHGAMCFWDILDVFHCFLDELEDELSPIG